MFESMFSYDENNGGMTMLLRLNLQLFCWRKNGKATPQKRREQEKKGKLQRAKRFSSALTFSLPFGFLLFLAIDLVEGFLMIYRHSFTEYMLWEISPERIKLLFNQLVIDAAMLVLPVLFVALLAGVFASYIKLDSCLLLNQSN